MTGTEDTPLDWALRYAARGWRVIPIAHGKKYPTGFARWQEQATTDTDTIAAWWHDHPGHGVGIVTGRASGLFVIDIDIKDGQPGLATWAELTDTYNWNEPVYTVRTGTGGLHLYFAWPEDGTEIRNSAGNTLGPGIDVRGEGGFVVAPPTIHPNGRPYTLENQP